MSTTRGTVNSLRLTRSSRSPTARKNQLLLYISLTAATKFCWLLSTRSSLLSWRRSSKPLSSWLPTETSNRDGWRKTKLRRDPLAEPWLMFKNPFWLSSCCPASSSATEWELDSMDLRLEKSPLTRLSNTSWRRESMQLRTLSKSWPPGTSTLPSTRIPPITCSSKARSKDDLYILHRLTLLYPYLIFADDYTI